MAPIRRYLRITRYSVLEVRIYLDNPALANSWLLNSRDPVLPRVIEAVRPLVLPKLREENENAKKKGGKKKRGVRDVVAQDDFEVSIFLTETSTTHAMLTKQKTFSEKPRLQSNAKKLTKFFNNNTSDTAIHVDDEEEVPAILLEEDAEETRLGDIPEAGSSKKRAREDEDSIFVQEDDEDEEEEETQPKAKRKRVIDQEEEDKKKLGMKTAYEGFSIYGRILCLIVKRKGVKKATGQTAGSQMLENWVSTQADNDGVLDDAEDG
ncbi:hypothetical protein E4T47_02078 [Aureobasidium subglaciale]|nr:hypothetical protein E4T43_04675 [Aureobasidium subglaciale]KAI5274862.1 hypothetical protein E4T47_02078 [Aureobasidium subglaciale]